MSIESVDVQDLLNVAGNSMAAAKLFSSDSPRQLPSVAKCRDLILGNCGFNGPNAFRLERAKTGDDP